MPSYLVFQLKAPLASFGSSLGDLRLSDRAPRKSAVTGLVAAALGITRDQAAPFGRLVSGLSMGVGVLREPLELLDWHTVQAPVGLPAATRADQIRDIRAKALAGSSYKGTMVTRREYVQDGHWLVALTGDAALLTDIATALNYPHFTLYLGRKSCPLSGYTAPLVVEANFAEDALEAWAAYASTPLPTEMPFYWDTAVASRTPVQAQVLKSDIRTHLAFNHFSTRTLNEGLCSFTEAPQCI